MNVHNIEFERFFLDNGKYLLFKLYQIERFNNTIKPCISFYFITVEEFFERAAAFLATERALMEDRLQLAYGSISHNTPSPQPGPSGLQRTLSPSAFVGAGDEDDSDASTIEFNYDIFIAETFGINQQEEVLESVTTQSVNTTPSDVETIYISDSDDDDDDNASQEYEKCGICFEALRPRRMPTTMCGKANHYFCISCISTWKRQPNCRGCPYCRRYFQQLE